jgi:RNA polymerase-binding transcription factor DksA
VSGYGGNPDLEAEHAGVLAENGIRAAQSLLRGSIFINCRDCGAPIPEARRASAAKLQHKCEYCISCQELHDQPARIRMLDRIL